MDSRHDTTEWAVAAGAGLVRIAAGVALLRGRREGLRLVGARADDRVMSALFVYFGVRDLTLGVHALAATRPGGDASRELTLHGVADAADAVVLSSIALSRLPRWRGYGAVALAGSTALGEFAGAWWLRRRRV